MSSSAWTIATNAKHIRAAKRAANFRGRSMEVSFGLNMKWIIQRTGLSRGIFPAFNVVNFFAIQSEWRFVSADSVRIEKQNTYTSVMATLLPNSSVSRQKLKGYRVFVFSHDHPLPAHIHFGKRRASAVGTFSN